jgi:hypothetical protein
MIVFRILLFPFKLVFGLVGISLKAGYKVGRAPFVMSAKVGKFLGPKGLFWMGVGGAIGYVLGSSSSSSRSSTFGGLVRRREQLSDDELAEKVKFELSHDPKTWRLPQPEVRVVSGRVELIGEVPDADAREDLARVAMSVPGVMAVENRLTVASSESEGESPERQETETVQAGDQTA